MVCTVRVTAVLRSTTVDGSSVLHEQLKSRQQGTTDCRMIDELIDWFEFKVRPDCSWGSSRSAALSSSAASHIRVRSMTEADCVSKRRVVKLRRQLQGGVERWPRHLLSILADSYAYKRTRRIVDNSASSLAFIAS